MNVPKYIIIVIFSLIANAEATNKKPTTVTPISIDDDSFKELMDQVGKEENMFPSIENSVLADRRFRWLIPGIVAGMAQPGRNRGETLAALKAQNIDTIISLNNFPWGDVESKGFHLYSIAMPDKASLHTDGLNLIKNIVLNTIKATTKACAQDKGIVIHCQEGHCRTGIILECWLLAHTAALNRDLLPLSKSTIKILRDHIRYSMGALDKKNMPNLLVVNAILKAQNFPDFLEQIIQERSADVVARVTELFPLDITIKPKKPIVKKNQNRFTEFFRRMFGLENKAIVPTP